VDKMQSVGQHSPRSGSVLQCIPIGDKITKLVFLDIRAIKIMRKK
jgi:hypothetical protein